MFCRRLRTFFSTTFVATVGLAGCVHKPKAIERLAVVPFENLSTDSQLDGFGRAAAEALVYDLAGADLYAEMEQSMNGVYDTHGSRVVEGYFSESGGRVELHAAIEDIQKRSTAESILLSGRLSEGVLPLVNQLARRLSPKARSLEAKDPDVFGDYAKALSVRDVATALQDLESATKLDPKFTLAYLNWARVLLAEGKRDDALTLLQTAAASHPDPIDQARIAYLAVSAAGDVNQRQQALRKLTEITPADAGIFRELAQIELRMRDYPAAVRDEEKATQLNPDDPQMWNEFGYALAYTEDLAGARQAIEHYRQLLPKSDANALDSLAEVNFYLGDFAEAEKFFLEANAQNHAEFAGTEIEKAAEARLMTGQLQEADALFQKYAQGVGGAPSHASYLLAQWEFLTGRPKPAMERLEKILAEENADIRTAASCQLSIWKFETGDPQRAAELADRAVEFAASAASRNLSSVCRAIVVPSTVEKSQMGQAYGLLLAGKFADAAPLLEILYRGTSPLEDAQVRILLAWAYVKTGRLSEASPLLRINPLPLNSGESIFASMIFPRYLFLRGVVFEKEGKRAEAKQSYELFLKYAGDVPDTFGEQAAARASVGRL